MDIDLSKVIGYSQDCLQNRALMRAIIRDLYPEKTREMNVLLDVYESGVPRKIKNDGKINEVQYSQYVQKIIDEYGLQEALIVEALNAWIDVYIGKGSAARINYKKFTPLAGQRNVSQPTSQHVHQQPKPMASLVGKQMVEPRNISQPTSQQPKPMASAVGKQNDYEIRFVSTDCIEISKYVGFEKPDMLVPNEINGKRVVAIGDNAFKACAGIRRLAIETGIKTIGKSAFANCKNLVEVTIGEGTEIIRDMAFSGCVNLKTVNMPSTLITLGGPKASRFEIISGVFSYSGIEEIDFPNGIKTLPEKLFYNCGKLRKVHLPNNLTKIEAHAFEECKALMEIAFPGKTREIGEKAFYDCDALANVQFNEGLRTIGGYAFAYCGFTKVTIPASVESFGSGAFSRLRSTLTVSCYPGSKAIKYARLNHINITWA